MNNEIKLSTGARSLNGAKGIYWLMDTIPLAKQPEHLEP
jgi:hypothetical protein